jgi:hypothetical protein
MDTKCGAAAELIEDSGCAAWRAIPKQHRLGHPLCAEWDSETEATGAPGCSWQEAMGVWAAATCFRQQACSVCRATTGSARAAVRKTRASAL